MSPVELLGLEHVGALVRHLDRLLRDNAALDHPVSPAGKHRHFDLSAAVERRRDRWARALDQAGWARAWGVVSGSDIVGHAELHAGELVAERHRATVGLGVLARARRQGHALALMATLIEWARAQPTVAWLDLGVFASNPVAERLYSRLGFQEVARVADRFRVDGVSVTDVKMCLNVE